MYFTCTKYMGKTMTSTISPSIRISSSISMFKAHNLRRLNLTSEESGSFSRVKAVGQMSGGNNKRAITDQVSHCTEDLDIFLGVIGDLALILEVTCEAEENDTLNFVLDIAGELLNGIVDDSASLTVGCDFSQYMLVYAYRLTMEDLSYLYPPATIWVLGHLVLACSNSDFAVEIAPGSVFWGRAFCINPPVYRPPTP
jgi:hypothetical protein